MSSSPTAECGCRIAQDFDILRHAELFAGAPTEVVKLFAYFARHRRYGTGEEIIARGNPADSCYLIISGEVELLKSHRQREIVVQYKRAEDFFGELALLARFDWFFSARARTETELLVISRESFQKVLDKYPELKDKLTENVIQLRICRFESQTDYLLDRLLEAGLAPEDSDRPLIG